MLHAVLLLHAVLHLLRLLLLQSVLRLLLLSVMVAQRSRS